MKKIYCGQCVHVSYIKDKGGYYCGHPVFDEKKLVKVCQRYQLGVRSPRECPRKKEVNKKCKKQC